MSCIVWNVRGLGNQRAFQELKRLIAEKKPSFLFICETRKRDINTNQWEHVLEFDGCFSVDYRGHSGGLCLLWREPLVVSIKSFSKGHIDCMVEHNDKKWRFTGLYGNPDTSLRFHSWLLLQRLAGIHELQGLPWLVGGDFNEIFFDSEKLGRNKRPTTQTKCFREALYNCNLQSLHCDGETFTWVNRRVGDGLIFENLDRYVSSFDWRMLYPTTRCSSLYFYHSDHRPLLMHLGVLSHTDLFRPKSCDKLFRFEATWMKKLNSSVTTVMNNMLDAPFTQSDVKKSLFDMSPDKALGPNGMSMLFYQKYWHIVWEDVTKASLDVLNEGASMDCWNKTVITLIPKVQNPLMMKEVRPINLCNVCYKIISQALTNRLRPIMKSFIDETQSSFVLGRLITDNVILGFETIHWMQNRKTGNDGFAALKLDMSKAYERVEWYFLELIMRKMGFREGWISKIMRCISSVSYSFSLNQQLVGHLNPQRGIRQGDPLSPYLFTLCAQGVVTRIHDSLVFFKATRESCSSVLECLCTYEKPSGQGHEIYLGLSMFSMHVKIIQFGYLLERVVRQINGCEGKMFSVGGNEVLIKSVLQAMPSYSMSCFRIPKATCASIEKDCADIGGEWIKVPPKDCLFLDVDASFNQETNCGGLGGVIRNHRGQVVVAFGKRIQILCFLGLLKLTGESSEEEFPYDSEIERTLHRLRRKARRRQEEDELQAKNLTRAMMADNANLSLR
ncbi:uncharacterized protein [Henckelia pumila]|uniref:uncharacterized protein n=1 Tax=Henckelia pumila TaxID=405737 RepID=UPI003C6E4B7E